MIGYSLDFFKTRYKKLSLLLHPDKSKLLPFELPPGVSFIDLTNLNDWLKGGDGNEKWAAIQKYASRNWRPNWSFNNGKPELGTPSIYFDYIENRVTGLEEMVTGLEGKVTELKGKVKELERRTEVQRGRIQQRDEQLSDMQTQEAAARARIVEMAAIISDMKIREADLETDLEARESAVQVREGDIEAREADMEAQEEYLEAQEADMETREVAMKAREAAIEARETAIKAREADTLSRPPRHVQRKSRYSRFRKQPPPIIAQIEIPHEDTQTYWHAVTASLDNYGRMNLRVQNFDPLRKDLPPVGNVTSVCFEDLTQFVEPFNNCSKEEIVEHLCKLKGTTKDMLKRGRIGGSKKIE